MSLAPPQSSWSARQIHDSVAAIVARRDPGALQRESLLGRFLRFVARQLGRLFDWIRGSLDARIIVIAAVIVVFVVIIARVIAERRSAERRMRGFGARGARGERRDRRLVSRELAAAGRFAEASHELYAATVEQLAAGGFIRFHQSKTAGDYARELRRAGSPLTADFRAFGREFDRAVFGRAGAEPSAAEYDALVGMAERIDAAARRRPAA